MGEKTEPSFSSFWFSGLSFLSITVLFLALALIRFLGFGFTATAVVTLPILILSTFLLAKVTKEHAVLEQGGVVQNHEYHVKGRKSLHEKELGGENLQPINETCALTGTYPQSETGQQIEYEVGSSSSPRDLSSDSESSDDDDTEAEDEGGGFNWMRSSSNGGAQNLGFSDGEDDSLIEIALAVLDADAEANYWVEMKKEAWQKQETCIVDDAGRSISMKRQQESPQVEVLANMNEEENLIEIDISMGSIIPFHPPPE